MGRRDALLLVATLAIGGCRSDVRARAKPPKSPAPEPADSALAEPAALPGDPEDTSPALTRDEIRLVVRAKLPDIRACFDAGLARTPELRGRVVLRFTIGPDGKARELTVEHDELGEPTVAACLVEAVPRWQFPRPRGGKAVTVSYPFAFSSEDSLRAAGLPRVEGTVKPEAVGAVFEARRAELDACVPAGAHGLVGVAFTIDDGGAVTRASSYADTLPDDAGACVVRTISSWVFPPAAADDEAKVNHDLRW